MTDANMPSNSTFPRDFLWGTATAAHQVEGGNWNNDWWAFEHDPSSPAKEPSGDACDHYWRYPSDIALLADLGFGAYRFSVEWSRIEPAEGEFSKAALDHYRRMLATTLEHGLVPVVTFHHFTTPRWVADEGGWERAATPERFARFCARAVEHLGDLVGMACTINEPNIVSVMGYLLADFPPGVSDADRYLRANDEMIRGHRLAFEALKAGPGDFPVGMTLSMQEYAAEPGGEELMERSRRTSEDVFLDAARGDDYLGAQMYTRLRFGPDGLLGPAPGVRATIMGYERWPQALEHCVRRAAERSGCPIYVTENGIATSDDAERIDFVIEALQGVRRCLDDGVDLRGYFYWSLLDNFEWSSGYGPTFGLVAVDRATQERTVKPSARWLGEVARTNTLTTG